MRPKLDHSKPQLQEILIQLMLERVSDTPWIRHDGIWSCSLNRRKEPHEALKWLLYPH